MADLERENSLGFVDKRRTPRAVRNTSTSLNLANNLTYTDVASLRAFLSASSGHGVGYYSTTRLNQMTKNDMVMSARRLQDAAGLNTGST